MENPIKMDDLGVPLFFGNTHVEVMKGNAFILHFLPCNSSSVGISLQQSFHPVEVKSTIFAEESRPLDWLILTKPLRDNKGVFSVALCGTEQIPPWEREQHLQKYLWEGMC